MELAGNYVLNIKFGEEELTISPQMIKELTISQDIDRLLPTFKLVVSDPTKILADIIPYDKGSNKVRFEISRGVQPTEINQFDFTVKRRNTTSPEEEYSIEGVLDLPYLITDPICRAFTGKVRTNLVDIAEEIDCESSEIGASLEFEKTIIQADGWTTSKLLRYLQSHLLGKNGESGYKCFVKVVRGGSVLVFKSLEELYDAPTKYNFIVGGKNYKDCYPIMQYKVFDNSQMLADLGGSAQDFGYFNYETGIYIDSQVLLDDCPALSEFFLVDTDRGTQGQILANTGRTNEFHGSFGGQVKNNYYNRVSNWIQMWGTTWGMENISPGDIVQVVFSEALEQSKLFLYLHSGLWMVKRVVHSIGSSFLTNLLLARCGVDTDTQTSLQETVKRKR